MDIDEVNYSILKIIAESDKPIWKNRIHERLNNQSSELPDVDSVSVQTVGRRVDTLRDNELLQSCIISPEDIKRDLIIAFKTTEEGEEIIREKQEQFMEHTVRERIFSENSMALEKPALIEIICSHFDLDTEMKELMNEEYTRDELLTFLTLYYVKRRTIELFDDESAEKFVSLADKSPEIANTIDHNFLDEQ